MHSSNFFLEVIAPGAKYFNRAGLSHVSIAHKSNFKLKLSNNRDTPADASVFVQGIDSGIFRVPANDSIIIDRPSDNSQLFIALVEDIPEAVREGILSKADNNGKIVVTFAPEKKVDILHREKFSSVEGYFDHHDESRATRRLTKAEGIVLEKSSVQSFNQVPLITNIDFPRIKSIEVRLVAHIETTWIPAHNPVAQPSYNPSSPSR